MADLRLTLAKAVCRATFVLSRAMGKNGSSKPGQIALKFDPRAIQKLCQNKKIIVITGTNGKTSTNNLLARLLIDCGKKVVSNLEGSNMLSGIATALLLGDQQAEYACFEVDEAYCRRLFSIVKPDIFVVTNLFADQTDRYGKDGALPFIHDAIALCSEKTKIILNGNDPTPVLLNNDARASYFVCNYEGTAENPDISCPICGNRLAYHSVYYDQIGNFSCTCGYRSHGGNYIVDSLEFLQEEKISFMFNKTKYTIPGKALYHVYNASMALCALSALNETPRNPNAVFDEFSKLPGRFEQFDLLHPTILNLAKNPTGFNLTIDVACRDNRKKAYLISVNDNEADGVDITWIWDVEFEKLFSDPDAHIFLCGMRANTLALRLQYADCPCNFEVYEDESKAMDAMDTCECEVCYAICNYTAITPVRNALLKKQKVEIKKKRR